MPRTISLSILRFFYRSVFLSDVFILFDVLFHVDMSKLFKLILLRSNEVNTKRDIRYFINFSRSKLAIAFQKQMYETAMHTIKAINILYHLNKLSKRFIYDIAAGICAHAGQILDIFRTDNNNNNIHIIITNARFVFLTINYEHFTHSSI